MLLIVGVVRGSWDSSNRWTNNIFVLFLNWWCEKERWHTDPVSVFHVTQPFQPDIRYSEWYSTDRLTILSVSQCLCRQFHVLLMEFEEEKERKIDSTYSMAASLPNYCDLSSNFRCFDNNLTRFWFRFGVFRLSNRRHLNCSYQSYLVRVYGAMKKLCAVRAFCYRDVWHIFVAVFAFDRDTEINFPFGFFFLVSCLNSTILSFISSN